MSFLEEFGDVEVALGTLLRLQGEYARGVESTYRAHRDVAMKALYAEIRAYGDRRVKQDHLIVKSNYADLHRQHETQRAQASAARRAAFEAWLPSLMEQYSRAWPTDTQVGGMKVAPYETVRLGNKT